MTMFLDIITQNVWTEAGLTGRSGANVQQHVTKVCSQDKGFVTSLFPRMEGKVVPVLT